MKLSLFKFVSHSILLKIVFKY